MTEIFEMFAWTESAMCSGGDRKGLEEWMWQLKLANPRRSVDLGDDTTTITTVHVKSHGH